MSRIPKDWHIIFKSFVNLLFRLSAIFFDKCEGKEREGKERNGLFGVLTRYVRKSNARQAPWFVGCLGHILRAWIGFVDVRIPRFCEEEERLVLDK